MEIKRFRIRNYRAIEDLEFSLRDSISPIIGLNESGKTTVLQAIQSFDPGRDKFNKGEHLNYRNRYSNTDGTTAEITATVSISSEDWAELGDSLPATLRTRVGSQISEYISKNPEIQLTRILDSNAGKKNRFQVEDLDLDEDFSTRLTTFLRRRIPVILYFDDFTDRVPDSISFSEEYKTTGVINSRKGAQKEWQEILQEVFRRASPEGLGRDTGSQLQQFLTISDTDTRDAILEDVTDELNQAIITYWKKIKRQGLNRLADDSDNLELQVKYTKEQGRHHFNFRVQDKSIGKKRFFQVNQRSKGFQWFFNYMMKLKYNPRYEGDPKGAIFLLDEPGSYLHATAQEELLIELKRVAESNKMIYCTHSQYLLDPSVVRLPSIRIASKSDGVVNVINYGECAIDDSFGALVPLFQALDLDISKSVKKRTIVVEGISDYCFFMLLKKKKIVPALKGWAFLPAASASKIPYLASLVLAYAEEFRLVFDADDAGRKGAEQLAERFDNFMDPYIRFYGGDKRGDYKLEDFFTSPEKAEISSLCGGAKIKKAIQMLYWDDTLKDDVESFLSKIGKKRLGEFVRSIID